MIGLYIIAFSLILLIAGAKPENPDILVVAPFVALVGVSVEAIERTFHKAIRGKQ